MSITEKQPNNKNKMKTADFLNQVFYKSSKDMSEIPNDVIGVIVTSPPYYNVKDYSKDGYQKQKHSKSDLAFGKHPAIMPEEIARRCIKLFSFKQDVVCDPFAGSGTTLKAAKDLGRNFVGYELYENYKKVIDLKLGKDNAGNKSTLQFGLF